MLGPAFFVALFALSGVNVNISRKVRTPFVGITGVWLSFPLADLFSTLVTVYFLKRAIRKQLIPKQ